MSRLPDMNVVTLLTASEAPLTASGTFLFTDIVGSTAMAEAVGDERWARVLRAHNAIIRAAIQLHNGEECAFLGDGFLVLFADAQDALACAMAVQEAFSTFTTTFPDAPLTVRMGLHCGTACREGRDVFGRTVHLASRVAGAAARRRDPAVGLRAGAPGARAAELHPSARGRVEGRRGQAHRVLGVAAALGRGDRLRPGAYRPQRGVRLGMARERDLFANFERMRREMDQLFGDVLDRSGLGAAAPRRVLAGRRRLLRGQPAAGGGPGRARRDRERRARAWRSRAANWSSPATGGRPRPRGASTSSSRSTSGRSGG